MISWNVNGIRAISKKGFREWVKQENPDILCLQETKARQEQVPEELMNLEDYHIYYSSAERPGYSGVALYSKEKPNRVETAIGLNHFDCEGRFVIAHYDSFILFNVYFPNGGASPERLQYKMDFYDAFLAHVSSLYNNGKRIIICGDVNTAHTEIDLARPKANSKNTGFLPEERAWIDRLIQHHFVDTFRNYHQEGSHYTWWDYKTRARSRNVGWRIDYFFISDTLLPKLSDAVILSDVMGSDHCPIGIQINV